MPALSSGAAAAGHAESRMELQSPVWPISGFAKSGPSPWRSMISDASGRLDLYVRTAIGGRVD